MKQAKISIRSYVSSLEGKSRALWVVFLGLLTMLTLLPVHTLLTVWATSNFGHLYVWSAWKEVLLMGLVAGVLYATRRQVLSLILRSPLLIVLCMYLGLILIYTFNGLGGEDRAAVLAGAAINARFVVVFGVVVLMSSSVSGLDRILLRPIVAVAAIVALLGIVQASLLPYDILTNFGYDRPPVNTSGIPPAYHFVGDSDLLRAQGTLRGPNVFGSYLILPFLLVVSWAFRVRRARLLATGTGLLLGLGILLSYSRSAWLGVAVGCGYLGLTLIKQKRVIYLGLASIVLAMGLVLIFRDHPFVRQTVLHHDSQAVQSSNVGHIAASKTALREVAADPLGDGLGSAGPVSALDGSAAIAENYFLQVGQELGWLGLGLLVVIHGLVLARLQARKDWLGKALVASLLGLIVTNLLLHTWADEAVALTWWALAGAVLGTDGILKHKKNTE